MKCVIIFGLAMVSHSVALLNAVNSKKDKLARMTAAITLQPCTGIENSADSSSNGPTQNPLRYHVELNIIPDNMYQNTHKPAPHDHGDHIPPMYRHLNSVDILSTGPL